MTTADKYNRYFNHLLDSQMREWDTQIKDSRTSGDTLRAMARELYFHNITAVDCEAYSAARRIRKAAVGLTRLADCRDGIIY